MGKITELNTTIIVFITFINDIQSAGVINTTAGISDRNNLPQDEVENIMAQFSAARNNEDINLNTQQLIRKYGYNVESHEVQTHDGYILTMFRIPSSGPVVFLMHGLLCSADDWISPGPGSGIAYLLADEGYDVWLGNARGNKHSRRHARLSPDSEQFWDFSWDEIGRFDLPAMLDHALATAGRPRLSYVGHSQGTTAFFVLCSLQPEYNDKVTLMVALSAVAWMSHITSPLIRLASPFNSILHKAAQTIGLKEFAPDNDTMRNLKTVFCGTKQLAELVCSNIMFIMCGFNYAQINITSLPVILSHIPSGSSTKQLVHYAQCFEFKNFQRFDYGIRNNKIYGSKNPPAYPVERITAPVAIFYSDGDWLAHIKDIQILRSKLKKVVDFHEVPYKGFNHLDFLFAKDVKTLIFARLLQLLRKIK